MVYVTIVIKRLYFATCVVLYKVSLEVSQDLKLLTSYILT